MVLGAPLLPPPALRGDAPLIPSTEKYIVGGAPLPHPPAVLRVLFLPLLASNMDIRFIDKGKSFLNLFQKKFVEILLSEILSLNQNISNFSII